MIACAVDVGDRLVELDGAGSSHGTKKAAIATATIPMIHFSQPRWRRIRSSIVIVKTSWGAGADYSRPAERPKRTGDLTG